MKFRRKGGGGEDKKEGGGGAELTRASICRGKIESKIRFSGVML